MDKRFIITNKVDLCIGNSDSMTIRITKLTEDDFSKLIEEKFSSGKHIFKIAIKSKYRNLCPEYLAKFILDIAQGKSDNEILPYIPDENNNVIRIMRDSCSGKILIDLFEVLEIGGKVVYE